MFLVVPRSIIPTAGRRHLRRRRPLVAARCRQQACAPAAGRMTPRWMLLAVLAALEAGRAAASTTKPAALLAVLAALEAGLTAASTPAEPAVIVNLLPEEGVYVKTRGMCTVNYTDSVGLTVPAYSVPPITPHWSIALRIRQRIPSPVTWESDGGGNRGWGGGSSGSYGGLIGYRAQFAMVMHEQIKNVKLAIPEPEFTRRAGRRPHEGVPVVGHHAIRRRPRGRVRYHRHRKNTSSRSAPTASASSSGRTYYWHPPHIMARLFSRSTARSTSAGTRPTSSTRAPAASRRSAGVQRARRLPDRAPRQRVIRQLRRRGGGAARAGGVEPFDACRARRRSAANGAPVVYLARRSDRA